MSAGSDENRNVSASPPSEGILLQEETLMKYFSGLIQASFGSVQSVKRTNGHMKVHWRVSVRSKFTSDRFRILTMKKQELILLCDQKPIIILMSLSQCKNLHRVRRSYSSDNFI
jgi:hypothetical protein